MNAPSRTRRIQRVGAIALATVGLAGLVACEPPPPPPVLHVTSTADGIDASPGDGVCETAPGNGECTLAAAVQEGNALGRALILVPDAADPYYPELSATITGHLTIRGVAVGPALIVESEGADLVIEHGASLTLDRFGSTGGTTDVRVEGMLAAVGSGFYSPPNGIVVEPTGTVVLVNTLIFRISGSAPLITNRGAVALRHVSLIGHDGTAPMIVTETGAYTRLEATSLHHEEALPAICTGDTPVSGGYNFSTDASCGLTAVGDQPNGDRSDDAYEALPGSPRVDAVPPGTLGCGTGGLDVIGRPRSFDGDGDGVAQCDIGAWEWQPDQP